EDRWGRFDTAFVSVVDRGTGAINAVLGIDVESAVLDKMAREARLPPLIISLLFAGLVVTFLMAKQHDARAQWLLVQAEESTKALLDNIPETACLVDIRGRVLACNSEMRRRELRDVANDATLNLPGIVPAFRDFWTGDQWSVLGSGTPGRFHDRHDGREVDYRVQPVIDKAGRVNRLAILGIDITERLRIEEALRAGEERFRDIAMSSADWVWEVDAVARYTFASGRVEDVLGYRPDEVVGKTPFDFMDADEQTRVREIFLDLAKRKAPLVDLENRCRHRDGREVFVVTSGVPILSETGDLIGYRGVDKDITARKKAEQALRDSEERFRALSENSPDVIMRFDREGRHVYVNPAVTRFTGFAPADFLGRTHREMGFPEDLCALWEAAIRRTFRQGGIERIEFDLPDGAAIDWLLVPEFDATGSVAHVMTSARDITARKMAEEALRSTLDRLELMVAERTEKLRRANERLEAEAEERRRVDVALRRSEERYRSLVETNNDWICEITVASEFAYNSPQVERLLGYEPDELIGKPFTLILSPDEAARFRRHFDSVAGIGGRMKGFEWTAIARDGRSVVFETNAEPFFDEGLLLRGYRAIHRDITERKAADIALRDSEERFRQLFAGVTDALFVHEIRNDGSPGRFVEVNDPACRRLGYSREELLRMSPRDIDVPPPEGNELTPIGVQLRAGRFLTFEQVHVARDGRHIPVEISSRVFELAGRSMVMSIARDISQRKEAERALKESEERFRMLTEESLTGVFLQKEGRLTYSNRRLAQMLGYRPEDIQTKLGTHVLEFVHPGDRDQVRMNLEERAKGGNPPSEYECRMLTAQGKPVWVAMLVSQITHDGIPSTIGHVVDVTERKRNVERLQFLSYHDPQTGLRNRTFFEELMERYSNGERLPGPVSIVVADIDGLKVVNDTFGHRAGDEHIATFARMLADTFNGANEVCRVGGDEFCVVMPDTPVDLVSLRVTEAIERVKRFNSRSPRIPISVSIGHSTSHSANESIFEVYQRADDNMYQYKLTQIESPKSRVIDILLMALAERDFVLQGHVERMVHMVGRMAELVGLPEHRRRDLILFARVHDLGKVGIPDEILFKPSALTPEEYAKIKMHVQIGSWPTSRISCFITTSFGTATAIRIGFAARRSPSNAGSSPSSMPTTR
ncbi:MAG: PAS domain S-box protein, partial [Deltaproteobacteria bacterium]|nr:PAS domain S-box protein [Deltaproteobacteria bacterium]